MPNFALALTTLAATVAITPYAYAAPSAEDLHQSSFAQDAVSADQLQGEISTSPAYTITPPTADTLDATQRNDLNDAADIFDELPSENTGSDPALEVIILNL